ncbi:MAG: CamS family sex pheromone protein [Sporolactobacillus sp.]
MHRQKKSAWLLVLLSLSLMLSGCSFGGSSQKTVVKKSNGSSQTANIIPGQSSKDYQSLQPQADNSARGLINFGVDNRVDIDQMETGLMNLSKSVYSPDDYVFQAGQYLTENDIDHMLYRQGQEKNKTGKYANLPGLNPPLGAGADAVAQAQSSPKYMNYVLEQDYMKKSGSSYRLAGLSLAISLNSVYSDKIIDANGNINPIEVTLDRPTVEAWGKSVAAKVIQRVRTVSGLENVPILLTLYMTAAPSSLIPGDFFAQTQVSSGSAVVGDWKAINDQHVLFPSDAATGSFKADAEKFDQFKSYVQSYSPNFIGVIGKAYYQDGNMADLTININIQFTDETEVIGLTNYIASIVNNRFGFSRDVPVHIYITSNSVQEALIERTSSMDNAYVSIYRH